MSSGLAGFTSFQIILAHTTRLFYPFTELRLLCENVKKLNERSALGNQCPLIWARVDSETGKSIGNATLRPWKEALIKGWFQTGTSVALRYMKLALMKPASPMNCDIIGTGFAILRQTYCTCTVCPYDMYRLPNKATPLVRLPGSRLVKPCQCISLLFALSS